MAGYNNGFFLASPDGNFSLKVGGQIQIRWTMNSAKEGDLVAGVIPINGDTQYGFENRRTKLDFSGNVFSKDWTYRVRATFPASTDGDTSLDFAYVEKAMDNGMSVRVGQFQAPWMREVLVDSSMQLAADRSLNAQFFGQGYSQGIQFGYETDNIRFNGGYFDGIGSSTTDYGNAALSLDGFDLNVNGFDSQGTAWNATPSNYAFAGRFEYKMSGDWSQFDDFSSFKGEEAGMMFGAAVMYQRANGNVGFGIDGVGTGNAAGTKEFGITADFTWDFGGASLFASGVWKNVKGKYNIPGLGSASSTTNPWGVTIQGGYFITEDAELFARYDYAKLDNVLEEFGIPGQEFSRPKYNGVTFGVNYFFAKGVKFTTDFQWNLKSLNGVSEATLNPLGLRTDAADKENQWALRAQLQLLF
jgi:phosphate-selective porin